MQPRNKLQEYIDFPTLDLPSFLTSNLLHLVLNPSLQLQFRDHFLLNDSDDRQKEQYR